jgi:hypothetical protein
MEYSNNDILFENDKCLAIKSPNMEEGLKVGPEFLTTTRHGKDVYNNRTVYFFINKEEKDTRYGIITLAFGEYFEVYDNYGDDIQLRDAFYYFPDLDKTITDIVGNVDLITTLVLIENGKEFDKYKLQRIDSNIDYIQYNKKVPANSKIYLEFNGNSGILSLMDFDSNDLYYIEAVLSRYGYSSNLWEGDTDYDWKEGNLLRYFNDGSNELLDKIVSYIKPDNYDARNESLSLKLKHLFGIFDETEYESFRSLSIDFRHELIPPRFEKVCKYNQPLQTKKLLLYQRHHLKS